MLHGDIYYICLHVRARRKTDDDTVHRRKDPTPNSPVLGDVLGENALVRRTVIDRMPTDAAVLVPPY